MLINLMGQYQYNNNNNKKKNEVKEILKITDLNNGLK